MWAFLKSVASEIEADIIIALLGQENIPVKKHYPGIGNLKTTYGIMNGVDLYVPKNQLLQAKERLSLIPDPNSVEFFNDPEDS